MTPPAPSSSSSSSSSSASFLQPALSPVLILNRGEVAVRLIRGAQSLGLQAVAIYAPDDALSLHVSLADVAVSLPSSRSYLHIPDLLEAASKCSARSILPGYGFLSEDAHAATAFTQRGIKWLGPTPETLSLFGRKLSARNAAISAQVPVLPASSNVQTAEHARNAVLHVGFPVLLKASAAGGGLGQALVERVADVQSAFTMVVEQAKELFSSEEVYVEKYIRNARHIEVQIFGDGLGNVVALGLRECSVQRRRQKVIEEAPPAVLTEAIATALKEDAVRLCAAHRYRSAGTVEFLVDSDTDEYFFLEVNARLQVEHGVTEMVTGIDIVHMMLRLGAGLEQDVMRTLQNTSERGAAIEARVYAENPALDYAPAPGRLSAMEWPSSKLDQHTNTRVRVDELAQRGTVVSTAYDPLLGKVLAWGPTRALAFAALQRALRETVVRGVASNVELLLHVLDEPSFVSGMYTTSILNGIDPPSSNIEVISAGLQSSIQDLPGRVGYWNVGVSPSGPMDAYAMGMANALVGNPHKHSPALEMTTVGPTLKFHSGAIIALTGALFDAEFADGRSVPWWTPFIVDRGSVLNIGRLVDPALNSDECSGGKVAYLAIAGGGFDVPKYLGSASTFPTGNFGGLHGGFLRKGDFLPIFPEAVKDPFRPGWPLNISLPGWLVPSYNPEEWMVGALNGPHGSEDFLRPESLAEIWTEPYKLHHAANRLGSRLIGPTPKWTRQDGGSAGLHPSNLHDYTYAPGAVNFSGNTPIVLMLDGPSLGGFICPITVASSEMWKVSQARPGESIRFKEVSYDAARKAVSLTQDAWDAVRIFDEQRLRELENCYSPGEWVLKAPSVQLPAIVAEINPDAGEKAEIKVAYRMSGDEHVLIEYGETELDLAYRMRVHMLIDALRPSSFVRELCPGVRSLLVRYNPDRIHVSDLIAHLKDLEQGVMGSVHDLIVPSRVLHLPLAFNDKWIKEAQQRYLTSVRPDAPYMPSNVEFVRRINGLASVDEVRDIMTSAEYLVLGLGDVYLGAPCAVPVDPRHRMVTSKYNPARQYTPEGAVGIGGAFMCIYGMDSPGGYQLCGRTLPIWDNYGSIPESHRGSTADIPWLLRFFDRVKFFLVSDEELESLRERYRRGDLKIDIREESFSYKEHEDFCKANKESIEEFFAKQQAAFSAERGRWELSGEGESNATAEHASRATNDNGEVVQVLPNGKNECGEPKRLPFSVPVLAGLASIVWSIDVSNGQFVNTGDQIMVLESMKAEIAVEAPVSGLISQINVSKGDNVEADHELCIIVSSEKDAMATVNIDHLRSMYRLKILTSQVVMKRILDVVRQPSMQGSFTSVADQERISEHLKKIVELRKMKEHHLPLFGIPFVCSDDIDVAGMTTSSGCKAFLYEADTTAPIINALEKAGAVLIGKTNMDQLNATHTGTESSYGTPTNPTHEQYICGGASGAGVAVQTKKASFAVTVDCNGTSALIPALVKGLVALKSTSGLIPLREGVLLSCPPVDALTIIGSIASDIEAVLKVLSCGQTSSVCHVQPSRSSVRPRTKHFKMAVIDKDSVPSLADFQGDTSAESAYAYAVQRLCRAGGVIKPKCNLSAFAQLSAALCNDTSGCAGRSVYAAAREAAFAERFREVGFSPHCLRDSTRMRIFAAKDAKASQLATAMQLIEDARRELEPLWNAADVVVLPAITSNSRLLTVENARQRPVEISEKICLAAEVLSALGLCYIALHAASNSNLNSTRDVAPRGVLVTARGFQEQMLLDIAKKWNFV